MSNKIDQRIVEMSFENHKFEKGIKESSGSLKEFAKALTDMGSRNNSFDGLEKSVKSVTNSFSIFEQVAIGALRQVGATAITTTANLAKSLSIDQLTAGLSKYEQKNASVQTIMNATGKSIDEINGYLDKLMWFSDETSYGFTDMTAALGQMTSTGGDIDKLIPMITGVANATAYAGKGAGEFSRAMYNLNQSYGTGSLKFMDWKSLELAGVASKELKQIFIDTAAELGKFDKIYGSIANAPVTLGTFGETLKDNWADTEVMEKAFGKFSELSEAAYELVAAGKFDTAAEAMRELSGQYSEIAEKAFKSAQQAKTFTEAIDATKDAVSTGWMETAEIIFGTLPEATENFTKLTEILWTIFASGAEARNSMLSLIKTAGGIKSIFKSLKNVALAFLTPLRAVSEAMDQFFPPKTEDQWMSIITSIESFTSKLIMSEERADQVRRTFAGFFAAVDIGWQVIKLAAASFLEIVKVIVPFNGSLFEATAQVGDFLVAMNAIIKESGFFQYGLLAIKIAVLIVRDAIMSVVDGIKQFVLGLAEAESPVKYFQEAVKKAFGKIFDYVKMVLDSINKSVPNTFSKIGEFIKDIFGDKTYAILKSIFEVLKEGAIFIGGYVVDAFRNFGTAVRELDFSKITAFVIGGILLMFVTQLTDLSKAMTNFVTTAGTFLGNLNKKMFSSTTQIKDFAFAIGVMTASLYVLSQLPTDQLIKGLLGLAGAIVILVAAYGGIQAINTYAAKSLKGAELAGSAFGLVGLAASLAIMAGALRTISKIDQETVAKSTLVMGAMIAFIAAYQAALKYISTIPGDGKATVNLVAMALGLAAISKVIYVVNKISQEDLDQGLQRIAGIMIVITSLQALMSLTANLSGGYTLAANMASVSGGILALVIVMKLISGITHAEITEGAGKLIAIGIVLATIETLFGIASGIGGGSKFQTNILKVSAGILSMIALIAILGSIPKETLTQGLVALAKITAIILAIEVLTAYAAKLSGGAKLQRILGSVTLTMLGFVAIIGILTSFKDQSEFDTALINLVKIAALVLAIEGVTAVIGHFSGDVKGFGLLIGAVGAILSLTASIALLALIPKDMLDNAKDVLIHAGLSLGAMAIAFSVMINALSNMATVSVSLKGLLSTLLPALVGLGLVIGATTIFMSTFKNLEATINSIDTDSIIKFTMVAGLIGGIVVAFSTIPLKANADFSALIGGFGALAGVLAMTTIFFYALEGILPIVQKVTPKDMITISVAIGALTAVFAAFALLGPELTIIGGVSDKVLAGTVVTIAGVGLVLAAFVGLVHLANNFVASSDELEIGINKITTLSAGIGRMMGAFAGGIATESLIGLGEALSGFGNALGDFDPSAVEGVGALAKALLTISGAAVVEGLIFFAKNDSVSQFGQKLKDLIDIFKDISTLDAVEASTTMIALEPMAEGLGKLITAASSIPNSGGVIGWFAGENDLDAFAIQLKTLVDILIDIPTLDAVEASTTMVALTPIAENLSKFATAAKDLPNSGGVISWFAGNNDLGKFGENIYTFVKALSADGLSADTAGTAAGIINILAPIAKSLSEFAIAAKDLPNSGGVIGFFAGNNDIGKFGVQINNFISGIISNGLNSENVRQARDVMSGAKVLVGHFTEFMTAIKGTKIDLKEITSMIGFATQVKLFVNTLGGIDFSVVQPALKSISNITLSFENIGSKVMENARKSFENNKVPFQASISTILDETNKILIDKGSVLIKSMTAALDKMITTVKSYDKKFESTGASLVDGLARGITRNQSAAVNAMANTSKAVTAAAKTTFDQHSPSKVFEKIGYWLDVGLASGITNSSHLGVNATVKMGESMEEALRDTMGVHSESKIYKGISEWAGKSLGNGWESATTYANKKAEEFGIDTTKMSVKGVTESLSGESSSITRAVSDLIDILSGSPEVASSAGSAGTSIGNSVTSGMNSALKNSKTGIGGSKVQATVKSELEKLQNALEESKYYGQLSLEEELKAYEAIQKLYKVGSEERKKIDREVYRLTKEIYEAQISYIDSVTKAEEEAAEQRSKLYSDYVSNVQKAESEAAKKLSDLRSTYDKNVASARDSARQKEQEKEKRYQEDINRILDNAENERKKLREDYSKNQTSINEKLLSDIEAQNKAYEDAVKSRADAIYGAYSLFAKVEEDPEVTGEELLQNLRDQGAALSEWQQSLEELAKRGVSTALIEELQKLGPSSKAQIKALISLTDEQLTEYVGLFEGKYTFARVKAETELEGLKENTSQIIKDLKEQADIDLKNLDTSFAEAMAAVNAQMSADLATLKTTFDTEMSEIQSELSIKLAELKESFDTSSAEINADLAEKLSDMKKTYDESLTKINEDTANKLKELKASFSSTMKDTKSLTTTEMKKLVDENKTKLIELDKNTTAYMASIEKTYDKAGNEIVTDFASNMSKLNRNTSQSLNTLQTTVAPGLNLTVSQFEMAGYNAAAGFARGIDNGSYMAALSGQYLAQRAVDAAMMVLDEHSPSKVFHKIGSFASEGFANGITDAAELAVKASVKMAEGPIAAIAQALDSLENDMEYEPVISPVLDLSNISRTNLQGLFGSSIVSVGSIQRARESVQNGSTTNNTDSSIVNNFNIKELVVRKEDDIDKIAVSLYKKQQTDMRGRGIRPRLS